MTTLDNVCFNCQSPNCTDEHCQAALPFMNLGSDSEVVEFCQPEKGQPPYDNTQENIVNLFNSYTEDDNKYDCLESNDPDKNFYHDLTPTPSEYYTIENARNILIQNSANLSLMSLNIRSLKKNLDKLLKMLDDLESKIDIVCLNETWATAINHDLYNLSGYQGVHKYRHKRRGGGVAIFLNPSIPFIQLEKHCILNDDIECLFVKIDKHVIKSKKHLIVGSIYRPPSGDPNTFTDHLTEIISFYDQEIYTIIIAGDYNLDLLKYKTNSLIKHFLDNMISSNCIPFINKATRVNVNSNSLIDNIFTNDFRSHGICGIVITDVSDHFPIFSIMKIDSINRKNNQSRRLYNNQTINEFTEKILALEWDDIYRTTSVQISYSMFQEKICNAFHSSFPLKNIKKHYKERLPWISADVKKLIRQKNKAYLKSIKHPTLQNITHYKKLRNMVNYKLRKEKRQYFLHKLETCKNNPKLYWKNINENILGKTQDDNYPENFINITDGNVIENNLEIANNFNSFFVNIGPQLEKDIPSSQLNITDTMGPRNEHSLYLQPTDAVEVRSIFHSLNNTSGGGMN